jgi:tRNA(adenine34) deaminase
VNTSLEAITDLDLAMMERALDLGRRAAEIGEVPVGAVVYRTDDGRIVGEGFNRRELAKDPAGHAEFCAIREASLTIRDWRLNDYSLAVTLEPCVMCAGLIVNARLGRLLYGATDPKAGAVDSLYQLTRDPRLNHRVTPISGVMGEEAGAMLKKFFRELRDASK